MGEQDIMTPEELAQAEGGCGFGTDEWKARARLCELRDPMTQVLLAGFLRAELFENYDLQVDGMALVAVLERYIHGMDKLLDLGVDIINMADRVRDRNAKEDKGTA